MLQRHPSIDPLSSEAAVYPSTSVSMTGFAFSCCAAALPLLMRSTDPALLLGVATLLKEAVPLMSEPSLGRLNGDALTHACDHEVRRFQHLLNRLEQVLAHHFPPRLVTPFIALRVDIPVLRRCT